MADKEFAEITDAAELDGTESAIILQGGNSREATVDLMARFFRGSNINDQTGAAYTAVLTDVGGTIRMDRATANTVTIPPNSTTAMIIGSRIRVTQVDVGTTTIVAGGGVTINTSSDLILGTQFLTVFLTKVDTDVWDLHKLGAGDISDLDALTDVDLTTVSERDNDRIVFDGTSWVPVGNSILRLTAKSETHTNNEQHVIAWTEDEDTDSYFGGGTVADEDIEVPFNGRYRIKVKIHYTAVAHSRFIGQLYIRINRTGIGFFSDAAGFRHDFTMDPLPGFTFDTMYESFTILDLLSTDEIDVGVYQFSSTGDRTFSTGSCFLTMEYMGPTP